jgi:hypothetical protein
VEKAKRFVFPPAFLPFPPFLTLLPIRPSLQTVFFHRPALLSTSTLLTSLFAPRIAFFEAASLEDPDVELDDFLVFSSLPSETRTALDERQEWVRRSARDGVRLETWERERKEREKQERRAVKERAEERKRQMRMGARREDQIEDESDE